MSDLLARVGQTSRYRFKTRERELEYRRARGEASCAECRRLKLKCDRKVPCTSCERRGCQTICPNGSLSGGHGTRYVLANTDKLHKKLLEMSKRIRQLEDALQIAQASISPITHPLLSEELLLIKTGVDISVADESSANDENDPAGELTGALGTLTISKRGEAYFVGRVASEALLTVEEQPERVTGNANDLSEQIACVDEAFPFTPMCLPKEEILRLAKASLPPYARATALVEAYLGNIAWFCRVVQREQIMEELLPTLYKPFTTCANSGDTYGSDTDEEDSGANDFTYRLPLLLTVLACGAVGDLTLPIINEEAELYIQLARATLCLRPIFAGVSMESVQTVLMLAAYQFHSCRSASLEPAWKLMTFGVTLASSIGLRKVLPTPMVAQSDIPNIDRDPARWEMEHKLVQRRRFLFWEIFAVDKWRSLESGRPATFNLREVDCEFPQDTEATIADDGTIAPSFWYWKHRFAKEVVAPIAECLSRVGTLKYAEILELDRKVRDFEAPQSMLWSSFKPTDDLSVSLLRYMWGLSKEIALLFLHRNFFARALLENPIQPLCSPFAASILSAYASAITLLKVVRLYFDKHSPLLLRQWILWTHALTSGVIVGSIAVRGPSSSVASAALKELELAVELFELAKSHPVVRSGLPVLLRLLEKARIANHFSRPSDFPRFGLASSIFSETNRAPNVDEELKILGGTARYVKLKSTKRSSHSSSSSIEDGPAKDMEFPHHVSPTEPLFPKVSSIYQLQRQFQTQVLDKHYAQLFSQGVHDLGMEYPSGVGFGNLSPTDGVNVTAPNSTSLCGPAMHGETAALAGHSVSRDQGIRSVFTHTSEEYACFNKGSGLQPWLGGWEGASEKSQPTSEFGQTPWLGGPPTSSSGGWGSRVGTDSLNSNLNFLIGDSVNMPSGPLAGEIDQSIKDAWGSVIGDSAYGSWI
ncbi:hypothetical protein M0805_007639 [Coniferiporia weirii]|nr:hypothetical protein M0805_007639 [Coniferiporia weirii]